MSEKKIGRPRKPDRLEVLSIRVPRDTYDALCQLAHGDSLSDVVRPMIERGLRELVIKNPATSKDAVA